MNAVAFVDRDGTLVAEPPDQQVDRLDKIRLVRGVIPALLNLRDGGYRFVMVSNQDGLGSSQYPLAAFRTTQQFIVELFASQGIDFDGILICPHLPQDGCSCRKPATGLVKSYLDDATLDRSRSFVVGDRDSDLELARNMALPGYRLGKELNWTQIAAQVLRPGRTARVQRKTRETDIDVSVDLDNDRSREIETGIGFFDHMLEQIASHADIGLRLHCRGDLDVDEHHTVEDCALALGASLREALGDKNGVGRYGFVLPMDESQAQVALDLSGRAYFVFDGRFTRERVGGLPTELVPHFFRSLAESLGAALHLKIGGENNHHMIEAAFKGVGRCLRQAVRTDGAGIPSTKGLL